MLASYTAINKDDSWWLLYTWCNNHLSGKKNMFSKLDESFCTSVKIGDNTRILVYGKGKINIKLKDGSLNYISKVFYAPNIYQNLLSMGQLIEKKTYDLYFNKGGCTTSDVEKGIIAKVQMLTNHLFPFFLNYDNFYCHNFIIVNYWLWHL